MVGMGIAATGFGVALPALARILPTEKRAVALGLGAAAIGIFMLVPMSTTSIYLFSIVTGFLWLATVPPTSSLVVQMFGLRHMGTLYGIVFLNHQLGSFTGVWLGGYLYDKTGTYDIIWWPAAAIALITALIHIIIDERPVARIRTQTI